MAAASSGTASVTLPRDTQILITREFDAPAHLVWRAWTEPDLIARWWAGDHGTVDSIDVDLRVGGSWRYVMTAEGGFVVAFHGEYQAIADGERIVNTEVFEGAPGPGIVVTTVFSEVGGRTRLEMLSECGSQEVRDIILAPAWRPEPRRVSTSSSGSLSR